MDEKRREGMLLGNLAILGRRDYHLDCQSCLTVESGDTVISVQSIGILAYFMYIFVLDVL